MNTHCGRIACHGLLSGLLLLLGTGVSTRSAEAERAAPEPGAPVDYSGLAFEPARWEARKLDTRLVPWRGRELVFLTTRADLDREVMGRFLGRLDGGWALYRGLTGRTPAPLKLLEGKPVIAAVPGADLTCGLGCGFVGATGIEVAGFYDSDLRRVTDQPRVFPHYYFYEMGRNYYTFADRHSCFITGFAVFMRYVCMDTLNCEDDDAETRRAIERAEGLFSKTELSFLKGFTMLGGLDEKAARLANLTPSDQPVLYASAMLRLHRECGGNDWLKRFFAGLARCPEVKPDTPEAALRQSYHWMIAAAIAARRDLATVFVDQWRLPVTHATRQKLAAVNWQAAETQPAAVLDQAPPTFTSTNP